MVRFSILERKGLSFAGVFRKEDLYPEYGKNLGFCVERVINEKLQEVNIYPRDVIKLKQEHTDTVVIIDSLYKSYKQIYSQIPADGMITNLPGLALVITVADCVPVFLFDVKRKVLGLIHAGREGTRRKIVLIALKRFFTDFHSSPEDIHVLIGPSIGPCCYEVSGEVAKLCAEEGLIVGDSNKVDLWASNISQAVGMKVPSTNVILTGECTFCSDKYYSYRKGDEYARNLVIGMI
ncbi:MAG: polyphenol oxidase family protein [Candidatus Hydrogenedentes bacterium]|nr:polyphenol oxidase family protein [Candidatus Hydrogenedentota bacterium]